MKSLFIIVILTLSITGCRSVEEKPQGARVFQEMQRDSIIGEKRIFRTRPLDEPVWITSTYRGASRFPEYELFVGISPFVANERDSIRLAEQDAIQKVITFLGTYGENNLKRIFVGTGTDFISVAEDTQEQVIQFSRNFAEGLKTLESYTEWGERYSTRQIWENYVQSYVLYGMEREAYRDAQRKIKDIQRDILADKIVSERNTDTRSALEKAMRELDRLTE